MHGYSGHAYKFVRDDGEWVYVQIHVRADGGFKVFSSQFATRNRIERLTVLRIDSRLYKSQ
jgi:catalase